MPLKKIYHFHLIKSKSNVICATAILIAVYHIETNEICEQMLGKIIYEFTFNKEGNMNKVNYNLNIGELLEKIKRLPISEDDFENQITSINFIREELYKLDTHIANIFIDGALKSHFKFKQTQLDSLKKECKNCRAIFLKKENEFKANLLPSWYQITSNGIKLVTATLANSLVESENIIQSNQQYYQYRDGYYAPITKNDVKAIIRRNIKEGCCTMRNICDVEGQLEMCVQRPASELNSDPYLINLKNGIFNAREWKLEEHTPEILSTIRLNLNYDENADCPIFKQYLNDAMDNDKAQVALIQEILGYCLVPITAAQKSFVLVGVGGSGKSILLNTLNDILLGSENVSNVSWQAINERFKTALLYGKLANIFSDLPTKNIDDNGIFKALVGEDSIEAEKKHKDEFSFKNHARLLFSCNSIPRNCGDRSSGFYRRLIILRFDKSVPEEKRDPYLLDKLRGEADGIFMFALEGLKRLMENEFVFSETEKNAKELKQYREDSDSVLSFFNDCCVIKEGTGEGSTYLYDMYRNYCKDSGYLPCSQKRFVQTLMEAHPEITRGFSTYGKLRTLESVEYVGYT